MHTVKVMASSPYEVIIDKGILACCGELVKAAAGGSRSLIVSDSNVAPLYLAEVKSSLESQGYEVCSHIVPAGEESKNFMQLIEVINTAAEAHLSRNDVVVALGGGMVGDLAGLAAALYMRGIKYVQIPTTVLAAVDSSVGGKTAVDIPAGKNLAGAFYQPSVVICDYGCWDSLPARDRNSGYAEIIKYAMIRDAEILKMLDGPVEDLIARCVEIKAEIVGEDEKESGIRKTLNLGHTIGHAVEQMSNYELLHGEAVAIGMVMACDVAAAKGMLEPGTRETLIEALSKYELPIAGGRELEQIAKYMRSDKKAEGDDVSFVMPEAVGRCSIQKMKIQDIIKAL